MTSTSFPQNRSEEVSQMSKMQKLAALLVMIGSESAGQVLKNLNEPEIEAVTSEMAKVTTLDRGVQNEILREFAEFAIEASTSVRGGVEFAQFTLEQALGPFQASSIIGRISSLPAPVAAVQQIANLEPRQIFNLIKQERPQAIALILSYLASEKASRVLALLNADLRHDVLERLATLAPTAVEVVEAVVQVLHQKLGTEPILALRQTGGVESAADLLNGLEKETSQTLLSAIEQRNPDLGQAIRQKMFTFADLGRLDGFGLQRIWREVGLSDLAVALKGASQAQRRALLGSLSQRAAETVSDEISILGPVTLREIEAAQNRIVEVARRLEAEGEIGARAVGVTLNATHC